MSLPAADAVARILPGKQPFPRGTGTLSEERRYRGHASFAAPLFAPSSHPPRGGFLLSPFSPRFPQQLLLLPPSLPIFLLISTRLPPSLHPHLGQHVPCPPAPQAGSRLLRRVAWPRLCQCFTLSGAAGQGCPPLSAPQVPGVHRAPAGASEFWGDRRHGGHWGHRGDSSVPEAGPGSLGDGSQAAVSSTLPVSEGLGQGQPSTLVGGGLSWAETETAHGEEGAEPLAAPAPSPSPPSPRLRDAAAPPPRALPSPLPAAKAIPKAGSGGRGSSRHVAFPIQGPCCQDPFCSSAWQGRIQEAQPEKMQILGELFPPSVTPATRVLK